jgi:Ca2+-binding RTX toxin-like protein
MPTLRIWNDAGVDYRGAVVALANLSPAAAIAAEVKGRGITVDLGNGQKLQIYGDFTGNNLLDATGAISGLRLWTGSTVDLTVTGYNGMLTLEAMRGAMMSGTLFDMFNSVPYRSFGGAGADVMGGSIWNDVINGGGGADIMAAMSGDDLYIVDHRRDMVVELEDGGVDTVRSSVSHVLADNVERLFLTSHRASTGIGNDEDNLIAGNSQFNRIDGKDGNDTLFGGRGADYFVFSTELDEENNVDRILDFSVRNDTILLSKAVFDGVEDALQGGRILASWAFKAVWELGEGDLDDNDLVIYDREDGALYYRMPDDEIVQFADLSAGLALTHRDFLIIA